MPIKKTCPVSGEVFEIDAWEETFLESVSPTFAGKKYAIPLPTLCPAERMRRRLAFRNERSLFLRKCDLSGKQIVSMYPTKTPYTVYDKDVWYSDDWDPFAYGMTFDFEKTFFEQFEHLFLAVPRMARVQHSGMENSDFCNCASKCKNSYLCFSTNECEECMYGTFNNFSYRCLDCYNIVSCEECYECMDCYRCQSCRWTYESTECRDCMFCRNCVGCRDCLFCTNLRQAQYCIKNVQYSKEEYAAKKAQLLIDQYSDVAKIADIYQTFSRKQPIKNIYGVHNEGVSGNILDHCKNTYQSFECTNLEDCRYINNVSNSKNCMDFSYWGINCDHLYEVMAAGFQCSNLLFCDHTWEGNTNLILSESCMYSHDLFACDGLRHQQNCVLNVAYSRMEYETLCGRIIDHMSSTGEWGEFFPVSMSDFGYNETVAADYFPLTKQEALSRGYRWLDEDETQSYHGSYHHAQQIKEYDENIIGEQKSRENIHACLNEIHLCDASKKPFKIIPKELAFYIEKKLPIPTLSPDARHKKRMQIRNKRTLHDLECTRCKKALETSYDSMTYGHIVCEDCLNVLTTSSG